jgi:hypothetical protein
MEPIEGVRALEEISQLKYRHIRCIDLKLWDEIGDTLTEDATIDYGTTAYGKPVEVRGRRGIVAFYRTKLGPGILTAHAASQPEIALDGDAATGSWSIRDTVIATRHRLMITGAAFCHDSYQRGLDGRWRITRTGYTRIHEAMVSLADLPSFRLTLPAPPAGAARPLPHPPLPQPLPKMATRR